MRHVLLAFLLIAIPASAEEAFAPPGVLLPVFDTTLHLFCTGAGRTVVLEAGLGGNYLDWTLVQPLLSPDFRACSYDRAGAGFSARSQRPRTIENITEELHELVLTGGVARPFVLVGHSFGGMVGLFYSRRYPEDVAGLVLLDSMQPTQFARFAAAGVKIETDPHMVLGRTPAGAALYGLPDALHRRALSLATASKARVFVVREMTAVDADAASVLAAGFPHLPARVLVHGNGEWQAVPPAGMMESVWGILQGEAAVALGAPPPTVVSGSGHQIPLDAPAAVVQAICEISRSCPAVSSPPDPVVAPPG